MRNFGKKSSNGSIKNGLRRTPSLNRFKRTAKLRLPWHRLLDRMGTPGRPWESLSPGRDGANDGKGESVKGPSPSCIHRRLAQFLRPAHCLPAGLYSAPPAWPPGRYCPGMGKNASEAKLTPCRVSNQYFLSSSLKGRGSRSKFCCHASSS